MMGHRIELGRTVIIERVNLMNGQDDPIAMNPERERVVESECELQHEQRDTDLAGQTHKPSHGGILSSAFSTGRAWV